LQQDREHLNPGNFMYAQWRHKKKNGEVFEVEVNYHVFEYSGKSCVLSSVTDITEKKKAEQALAASDLRYRLFIKNSTESVFRYESRIPVPISLPADEQIKLFFGNAYLAECNDILARRYGYQTSDQVIGMPVTEFITTAMGNNIAMFRQFVNNDYRLENSEITVNHPDGKVEYLNSNYVGFIEKNCLVRVWGTSRNITDQKLASQKIKYLASLVENVSDSIYSCDMEYRIISWNHAAEQIFGMTEAEALGREISVACDIKYVNETRRSVTLKVLENGEWRGEAIVKRKSDGKQLTLLTSATLLRDENNDNIAFIVTSKDITERKEIEDQLMRVETEKQRLVHRATIEGQEKEKSDIAAELHDNVNQIISSAKLFMEVAKNNPELHHEMTDKSIETLGLAIQEIRKLSKSLTPPSLGRQALNDAISELIDDIHLAGKLRVDFEGDKSADELLSPELKLTLYRIVQEQLNNIIKYAQTKEAWVKINLNAEYVQLLIVDGGIGFDVNEKRRGIGLTNIINRAGVFNGEVDIVSAPGKGCKIGIQIPLTVQSGALNG
jgi:PAS domain S-box-containing protein